MHELLRHVLRERDLTRAGDVFGIPDQDIVDDLSEVIKQIMEISSSPDFCCNDHDQALIEICVARVTSCIKETGTLDKYCAPLVALLESCLHHNLMPLGHMRDDDPPHAKIASDIISCIVLVSFPIQSDEEPKGSSSIMELFLPVAVQFLHKGNREISRHMARYLSLAATRHAMLLKPHVQTIMDSIMSGNYPLCRILTNLYEVCPEPVEGHATALGSLVAHAEPPERDALFAVFGRIAARRPDALRTCLPQLLAHLCPHTAPPDDPGCMCLDLLQLVVSVSRVRAALVAEQVELLRRAARAPHASSRAVALVARALAYIGYHDKERAQEALNFALERLEGAEGSCRAELKAEVQALCRAHPSLFSEHVLHAVRPKSNRPNSTLMNHSEVNRTATGVTIVKLGGATSGPPTTPVSPVAPSVPLALANKGAGIVSGNATTGVTGTTGGYTRRAKLGDSRSTGRLHPGPNPHRSMTRLNVAGGSVGGLHKSMTRLSSSQQINLQQAAAATNGKTPVVGTNVTGIATSATTAMTTAMTTMTSRGGAVTVTTIPARPARPPHHHNIQIGLSTSVNPGATIISGPPPVQTQSISVNPLTTGKSSDALTPVPSSVSIQQSATALGHVSVITSAPSTSNTGPILAQNSSGPSSMPISIPGSVTVTSRRANNTSVTMINASSNSNTNSNPDSNANHRISYFEPYPMRDTVQHFCEKHLDKIKAYMDTVSLTLPPPAKCTIEERRSKKLARLQFACGWRGPHCLYARAQFSLRTRAPRVWIHLMFLALQARHAAALSSRDASVCSLKHCWDALHCDNRTFVTLVTGAFPGPKEQELVLNELQAAGFFDVFKLKRQRSDGAPLPPTHATWGCFLCTHPERAVGFLAPGPPVIEGQLKEKKGRWRLFRRWRTRYFTLSGAHLSYKGSSGESIDINQIRSVKVSRGARNIPKAFEIFTGDQTLILKPKDGKDAEQWVQCLSIAVAHSQARDAPAKANSLPARGLTLKSF